MAKNNSDEATKAGGDEAKQTAPAIGGRKRFSVFARGVDGKPAGKPIAVTDSPISAHARTAQYVVIDHANGDRVYDGANPAAASDNANK